MATRQGWLLILLAVWLAGATSTAADAAASEETLTRTADGFQSERGDAERRPHDSLQEFTPADAQRSSKGNQKSGAAAPGQQAAACCGFRIWSASTELFDDFDRDGYYTYLRVRFDVDTDYSEADVYADVWLRGDDGDYVLIHQSDVFPIYGSSGTDDYEVEAELVAGFPPGYYDVLIEVYDAFDDRFVADYDALDSSALGLLPMEDISFDGSLPPPVVDSRGSGGGGSLSLAGLAVLASLAALRRRRR